MMEMKSTQEYLSVAKSFMVTFLKKIGRPVHNNARDGGERLSPHVVKPRDEGDGRDHRGNETI